MSVESKVKNLKKLVKAKQDEFAQGDVIAWDMQYDLFGKVYSYAAIKASNDLWYLTGAYANQGLSLKDLAEQYLQNSDSRTAWNIRVVSEFVGL